MSNDPQSQVLPHLRQLLVAENSGNESDTELLNRFHRDRDENAFAAILQRHGAMVFGVCCRLLHNRHDAEDASQATFLVLAYKSGSIRVKESLGSWLHGVAFRVASDLRKRRSRVRTTASTSEQVQEADPASEVTWREIRILLDEELHRLPEQYQAPLVLCYLEGKTRDEASRELGCNLGTVKGRLDRGRALLRQRLTRRGVELSTTLLASSLAENSSATMQALLTVTTTRAARLAVTSSQLMGELVSAEVVSLVKRELRRVVLQRIPSAIFVSVLVVVLGGLIGVLWWQSVRTDASKSTTERPQAAIHQSDKISLGKKNTPNVKLTLAPHPDPLTSLFDVQVQQELKLSKAQTQRIGELTEARKRALKGLTKEARMRKWEQLVAEDIKAVNNLLTSAQAKRFDQLRLQQLGPEAFLTSHVSDRLEITDEQREMILKTMRTSFRNKLNVGVILFGSRKQRWKNADRLSRATVQEVLKQLTPRQKRLWEQVIGIPYSAVLPPPGRFPDILRSTRFTIRTK